MTPESLEVQFESRNQLEVQGLNSYSRLTSGEIFDETESHQKLNFGKKCQTVVYIIYLHLSTLK